MHDGSHPHGHGVAGEPHTHDHGETGESHTHDHGAIGESHTHDHGATGEPHTHDHGATGEGSSLADKISMDKDKLIAVLGFMKDHNREHAGELRNLLGAIKELGADEIADIIENSAEAIEEAAGSIEEALTLLAEV
jgi:hypothetical protein